MIRPQNSLTPSAFSLEEILKCMICFEKCVDARMCPNCSKLCCKTCIRKWLTENRSQCPHCRGSLRPEQLVSCRFIQDLNQAIETLSVPRPDPIEKCLQHDCPLNYFCSTCARAVCSDCAMFSAEHKGHEFKHLNSVYNQHLQEINSESKVLVKRINELEAVLDSLDVNIEKIKAVKSEKSREMTQCFEQMVNRLDEQLRVKTFELGKKREMICDEIKKMKNLQTDVDKELALVSKNKLILKSNDLVRKLQEFKEVDVNKFDVQQFSCEFKSEVVPQYVSGVFELKEFSKAQGTVEVVYSEVLDYNGLLWRLKVYPNGNGVAKGTYLSVFLELLKGYGDSAKYDYRVEMVNHQDLAQQVIREFASEFETGECWGYNRFFKISLLKDEGYLTDSDTLVMKFYVRAPSYFQLYKDQKNYIKYLQDKENSYKSKLAEFMEKIEEFGDNRMIEDGKNEEVSKEYTPNPPHELSTVMQKYLMSPPDDDSSDELTPVNIDWTQIQDMPDFNNYSDLTGNDPESPENQEVQSQEFWPLDENLIQAIESIQASLK